MWYIQLEDVRKGFKNWIKQKTIELKRKNLKSSITILTKNEIFFTWPWYFLSGIGIDQD